jgi:flagellin-specific chaperone FliS
MDTEQLTEEQLYYKEKYFKYKLKYLTLKEHLGGNKQTKATGNKVAPAAAKKQATVATGNKVAPAAAKKQATVASGNKVAPAAAKKQATVKSDDDNRAEEILKYLYELLDGRKKNNLNIDRIKKSMKRVLEKYPNKYDLTKLEEIKNMLKTVLKTPDEDGNIHDERELYNNLIKKVKALYFS